MARPTAPPARRSRISTASSGRSSPIPRTVAAALQRGEIDWWLVPQADLLPLLRKQRNVKVENIVPTGFIATLRFNQLNPPFDNPAIRRALLGAVQQSDYMIGMVGTDEDAVARAVRHLPPEHAAGQRCRHGGADRASATWPR